MCETFAKKSPKTWVQISLKLQQCNFRQQEPQENIFGSDLRHNRAFQYKKYSVFDSVFLEKHSVLLCILASLEDSVFQKTPVAALRRRTEEHGAQLVF